MNHKPYRSSGEPTRRAAGSVKCATVDCTFKAAEESIFCMACDNERNKPIWDRSHRSGSPTSEVAHRRRAISDAKRGITKAAL